MKFLVDLDMPHDLTLVLLHYLSMINMLLPLLWGVVEVVMEAEAMGLRL